MRAVWKENDDFYFYGETSLADPNLWHGKGILVCKEGLSLSECWRVNGKRHGKGRWIDDDKKMYVGEYLDDYLHGLGIYLYPEGHKFVGEW